VNRGKLRPPTRRRFAMQEAPLFDAAHLDRQTLGNETLRTEIVSLFLAEVERLLAQVERAPDRLVRASRLHAMMGLARNVGALRLAELCRALEARAERDDLDEPADLDRLRAAVAEVTNHLRTRAA
jgi:HPt (histidine-containing phosphotransfer) domain-containing protein